MSKVDELIHKGEQLEKKRIEAVNNSPFKAFAGRHNNFSGIEFQEWTSESIFFLEEQKPASLVTEELKQKYKKIEPDTSYEFYECLLGTLKAIKNQ